MKVRLCNEYIFSPYGYTKIRSLQKENGELIMMETDYAPYPEANSYEVIEIDEYRINSLALQLQRFKKGIDYILEKGEFQGYDLLKFKI